MNLKFHRAKAKRREAEIASFFRGKKQRRKMYEQSKKAREMVSNNHDIMSDHANLF